MAFELGWGSKLLPRESAPSRNVRYHASAPVSGLHKLKWASHCVTGSLR